MSATADDVQRQLARLNGDQLDLVAGYIERILSFKAEIEAETDAQVDVEVKVGADTEANGQGWIELKFIKGNGPYAYRRWREAGRLRSQYLGKVKGS